MTARQSTIAPMSAANRGRINPAATLMECNRRELVRSRGVRGSVRCVLRSGVRSRRRRRLRWRWPSLRRVLRSSRGRAKPAISICARSARPQAQAALDHRPDRWLRSCCRLIAVNLITPRYKSEARILIDGRENVFLRPNGERNEERTALDAEAVTSQVQLVLSRDLAREIIKKNKLAERAGIRSGAARPLAGQIAAGAVRHRPRSVLDDAGRAGARRLLRPADRLCRRQVARHRRRIPVARSGAGGARRQFDRRRLSGAAAERAAGAGEGREPVAVGRDRQSAQARSPTPNRGSRISARSRACSSAPTTPRCPTSRWASSTRSSTTHAR